MPGIAGGVTCVPVLEGPRLVAVHVPLAAQEVALVDDQVREVGAPDVTEVGEAAKVTVGNGVIVPSTVTVTDWTADPQLKV